MAALVFEWQTQIRLLQQPLYGFIYFMSGLVICIYSVRSEDFDETWQKASSQRFVLLCELLFRSFSCIKKKMFNHLCKSLQCIYGTVFLWYKIFVMVLPNLFVIQKKTHYAVWMSGNSLHCDVIFSVILILSCYKLSYDRYFLFVYATVAETKM